MVFRLWATGYPPRSEKCRKAWSRTWEWSSPCWTISCQNSFLRRFDRPLSGRNGLWSSSPLNLATSVSDRAVASTVWRRPARLSRPCSIRRAELPVSMTLSDVLSTRDLSWLLQPGMFCTSSTNRCALWPWWAKLLNASVATFCSSQSAMRRMGSISPSVDVRSSNWTRMMLLGGTPSASRSLMIWSWTVVLPTWRGPRTAMMGAIPESRRRRTRSTRWRRVGGVVGGRMPAHQGLNRRRSSASSAGK